jgi:hypothetical protein
MLAQNGFCTRCKSHINIVGIPLYIIFSFLIQLHRNDKDHIGQGTRELSGQLAGMKECSFTAVCMIVKAPYNTYLVRGLQSKNLCV